MEYRKICVEVAARFEKEGGLRPLWLVWEDGRRFEVERVKFIERAPSHVGAIFPVRYTCIIEGRGRELYFEPEAMRWFVEVPVSVSA